jgi:hypothetical protein
MEVVAKELLEDVASLKPSYSTGEEWRNSGKDRGFDLANWIEDKGIEVVKEGTWSGTGYKWILKECPWNGHTDNAPYIVRLPGGAIAAGCHHNSCQSYGWQKLREHYEPGCYERKAANGVAFDNRTYFSGVNDGSGARLPEVPRFPVEVLPASLKRFVEEAAASIGCPPEFIGVPMLTTLGAAIGNSRVLRLKKGYTQGAVLYTAIVAEPGAKKSPALAVATAPAWAKQDDLKQEYVKAMADYRRKETAWEAEKRKAVQGGDPIPEPPEKPTLRRTVINDTTVEALFPLLDANPRGLLSFSDELSGWVKSLDQYKGGKGSDRQKYLSMWSRSSVALDRKGQDEALIISHPFVGITGAIQPGILSEIKNNREDGFLDRILFAFSDPVPHRWSDVETSEEAETAYKKLYNELYALDMSTDENGNLAPRYLDFTSKAKELFTKAVNSLGEETERPGFPGHLKGPWSKMEAYLARLSLILAVVNNVDRRSFDLGVLDGTNNDNPTVGIEDVKAAIALIEYFKAHARRVYAKLHGEKPERLLAEALRSFLDERGGYWEGKTSDLYGLMKARSAPGLPGSEGPFGKRIRCITTQDDELHLEEGHQGKDHIIKLSLSTLGAVGDADTSARTEGTEGRNGDAKTDEGVSRRFSKIIKAIDQLFKDSPEHKDEPEPDLMAMELFYFQYLDFYPEDEEIERALKLRVGA